MQKAVTYNKSVLKWLIVRLLSPHWRDIAYSKFSCIKYESANPPPLPNNQWIRVLPKLSGICGSDISTITCKGSPYFSPLISSPFVLGHEVTGVITEVGSEAPSNLKHGMRVVIEPALSCVVRGITPPCLQCANGNYANCENVISGIIKPGIQTGYCASTGGGWSNATLVAHHSQIYPIPDNLEDTAAVLAEPLACAIHSIVPIISQKPKNILVIGCGTVGLLCIAAYRLLGGTAPIFAVAKYSHQAEFAQNFGATKIIRPTNTLDFYKSLLNELYGNENRIYRPEIGKPVVLGGFDVVMDCIASDNSIDDSVRLASPNGKVILVGMPSIPRGIDWTPIWYKNLSVQGTYAYGYEELQNGVRKKTIQIAIDLLTEHQRKLKPLLSRTYPLDDYKKALYDAFYPGKTKSIKIALKVS